MLHQIYVLSPGYTCALSAAEWCASRATREVWKERETPLVAALEMDQEAIFVRIPDGYATRSSLCEDDNQSCARVKERHVREQEAGSGYSARMMKYAKVNLDTGSAGKWQRKV